MTPPRSDPAPATIAARARALAGGARALADRTRPLAAGAPLAPLSLLLWAGADAVLPELAVSASPFRLTVDVKAWQTPGWGWLPLCAALLIALAHGLRTRSAAAIVGHLQLVSAFMSLPIVALAALRGLSLWHPAGAALPWLGLVWAPHASVGVAFIPVVQAACCRRAGTGAGRRRDPITAAVLVAVTLLGYGAYALWICQATMLHGDEAQYLIVTQSLHRDGDMDLANQLDARDMAEYHVVPFGVHEAPASPPGRVHSVHPVGLSAALVLPYRIGLSLWANPRLACVLLMAAVAAAVVGLLFLWLRHLDIGAGAAAAASLVCASTTPLLLFSTQLYPELPAVAVTLIVLLRLPARPWQPPSALMAWWEAALLSAALCSLPFLHPRYLPLTLLLGGLLLWQAWRPQRRSPTLAAIAVPVLLSLAGLVAHNLAFTGGDWLGHFRPGNAWEDGALEPSTWPASLPGHWLHQGQGLALSSPVFFVGLAAGLTALARRGPGILLGLAALYAATAAVNGLHWDWTFGYCLPARFLLTALPALALTLGAGLETCSRRPWLALITGGALAVSWDAAVTAVRFPELAFLGNHVPRLALSAYYAHTAHGVPDVTGAPPVVDLALWSAVAAAVLCLTRPGVLRRPVRVALGLLAAATPALWGLAPSSQQRVSAVVSPYLERGPDGRPQTVSSQVTRRHDIPAGRADATAADGDSPEARQGLSSYYLPLQLPGVYQLRVDDEVSAPQQAIVTHRLTLPAVQPWVHRRYFPLPASAAGPQISYYSDRARLGYLLLPSSGTAEPSDGVVHQYLHPVRLPLVDEEIGSLHFDGDRVRRTARASLEPGRYVVRCDVRGSAWATLFDRKPAPVRIAVVVSATVDSGVEERASWFASDRETSDLIHDPPSLLPKAEAVAAPWWTGLPWGDGAYELTFHLPEPGVAWLLYAYDGDADLDLRRAVLYRQSLETLP